MAENESNLFHLQLIRERNLSEQEAYIVEIFAHGMQPATPEAAVEAACELDRCCPPLEQDEETGNYLWIVWEIMLDIARSPGVTNEVQERLVSILENLQQIAKGELNVWGAQRRAWKDLPFLPMCMDATFDDPMTLEGRFTPSSAQIWLNMNTFGARCMGSGVVCPYSQAMYALRSGLEEDLSTDHEVSITECKIQVACVWIAHGGKPLLWWALENIGYLNVTVEDEAAYVEGGSLYHGNPTMCLQRWGFWMDRFEELGKEESGLGEEIRKSALEIAQTMKTIERGMANTLS